MHIRTNSLPDGVPHSPSSMTSRVSRCDGSRASIRRIRKGNRGRWTWRDPEFFRNLPCLFGFGPSDDCETLPVNPRPGDSVMSVSTSRKHASARTCPHQACRENCRLIFRFLGPQLISPPPERCHDRGMRLGPAKTGYPAWFPRRLTKHRADASSGSISFRPGCGVCRSKLLAMGFSWYWYAVGTRTKNLYFLPHFLGNHCLAKGTFLFNTL